MADGTRACPQCAETIPANANFCSFCKCDLRNEPAPGPSPGAAPGVPAKKGMTTAAIVTIVCLAGGLLLVACGGIVAAIAWPALSSAQRAANERSSSSSLKTLATAEADFRSNDRDNNRENDFWVKDVRSLYYLEAGTQIRLIEPSIADADGSSPSAVPKAGYFYKSIPLDEQGNSYDIKESGRNGYKFAFCAYPASYGGKSKLTFIINEDNTIWKKDTGGQPVRQYPMNPPMEGWERLD